MSAQTLIAKDSLKSRFRNLDLHSGYALVNAARKGVKTKIFYDFAEAVSLSEKTLADILNISARTVSNYKEKQKALDPVQSEHLLKLISLFEKGETIFGNIDEFNYWLKKPSWNDKEKPFDWLNTPGGIDLITEEIDRLAYAYVV